MTLLRTAVACLVIVCPSRGQIPPDPPSPVPNLVRMLQSDDPAVRLASANHLGLLRCGMDMGEPAESAMPALLRAFESDAAEAVALAAALALLDVAPMPRVAFDHVEEHVAAWDDAGAPPDVIAGMRAVLAAPERAWPGTALAPHLAALARESPARHGALASLLLLGTDAAAATPVLENLLANADPAERWRAALTLASIGGGDREILAVALKDANASVRLAAALALQRTPTAVALPAAAVLPWLSDPSPLVQRWSVAALPRVEAVPLAALRQAVTLLENSVAGAAAEATLVSMGPRAAAAVPELVTAVTRDNLQLRRRAIEVLGAIGPAAATAVETMIDVGTDAEHGEPRGSDLPMVLGPALARIEPARAVTLLMRKLQRDAAAYRDDLWPSARLLAAMGTAAEPELPSFVTLIERGSRPVMANALDVIAAFGPKALPALPTVLEVIENTQPHPPKWEPDHLAWCMALRVVRSIGAEAAGALPLLQRRMSEVEITYRVAVVTDLQLLGATAEDLLRDALRDPVYLVRSRAAESLARLDALSAAAAEDLAALVARKEKEADGWGEAVHLLSVLEPLPASVRALLPSMLDHPSWHIRYQAARRLAAGLAPGLGENAAFLRFLTMCNPELNRLGPVKLTTVSDMKAVHAASVNASEFAAFVRGFAAHDLPEMRAAVAALLALPEFTSDLSVAVLVQLTGAEQLPLVRSAACNALGAVGPRARAALPGLALAFRAPEPLVRDAATAALRAVHGAAQTGQRR